MVDKTKGDIWRCHLGLWEFVMGILYYFLTLYRPNYWQIIKKNHYLQPWNIYNTIVNSHALINCFIPNMTSGERTYIKPSSCLKDTKTLNVALMYIWIVKSQTLSSLLRMWKLLICSSISSFWYNHIHIFCNYVSYLCDEVNSISSE